MGGGSEKIVLGKVIERFTFPPTSRMHAVHYWHSIGRRGHEDSPRQLAREHEQPHTLHHALIGIIFVEYKYLWRKPWERLSSVGVGITEIHVQCVKFPVSVGGGYAEFSRKSEKTRRLPVPNPAPLTPEISSTQTEPTRPSSSSSCSSIAFDTNGKNRTF